MATAVKTPKKRRLEAPLKTFTIRQLTKTDKNAVLAAKASKLLGYKLFGKHLRQPEVLGKALMELDIHPLDRTSVELYKSCLLYTSPSPRDGLLSRMPSSA